MATTYQQSAEQNQQDTWLTQKNTACGATASETNSIRGTRATNARVCHMRGLSPVITAERQVSVICALTWNSLYTRRRIRDAIMFFLIHLGLMHISLPVIITTADARTRRQHKHKLRTLPATCTPYQQSFYVRCYFSSQCRILYIA